MSKDITSLSLTELEALLSQHKISSRETVGAYLDVIANKDDTVGAFITVTHQEAYAAADRFDNGMANGPLGGIPFAVKDNLCTKGIVTTCASRILENYVPPYDAAVCKKLGASPILGKTNMDEFGMGSACNSSAFKVTKNPLDLTRTAGGSSGGSAAAVAAGMAPFALGSDTGGSVRTPAAYCGVVGLCPTYGAVSRYGLIEFASSLDRVGVIARTVKDSARVFYAIAGRDEHDRTSKDLPRFGKGITKPLKVGVLPERHLENCSATVSKAYFDAVDFFATLGCEIVVVDIPSFEDAPGVYYVISSSEAASNLARYDGVRFGAAYRGGARELTEYYKKTRSAGFGYNVKKRILFGTYVNSREGRELYHRACSARNNITKGMLDATKSCDVIVTPTSPISPPCITEIEVGGSYIADLFTLPSSLSGLPAISVPSRSDLTVGIQLVAAPYREDILFFAGEILEGSRYE